MPISARGIAQRGISLTKGIATRGISVSERQCWAYNFDGVDDRGVLATRAINIEGDNSLEFFTPTAFVVSGVIVAQNISASGGAREFQFGIDAGGIMYIGFGGTYTTLYTAAQGLKTFTRYGLTLIGTEAKIYEGGLGGTLVRTVAFAKGAAREPAAPTLIGCRGNGAGAYAQFYQGLQYDIRINGTLWEMGNRAQAIQPSLPAGNNMTLFNTTSDRWQPVPCRVYADPLTPFFTQQPSSQSVAVGATPTFTADALVDQGTVTYQWQLNTGGGFADIVGATLKTLTLLPVAIGQNGNQFRVVVTANARPIFSITATLTVTL